MVLLYTNSPRRNMNCAREAKISMMMSWTKIENATKRQPYAGTSVVCSIPGLGSSPIGTSNGRLGQNQVLDSRYIRQ